MMSDGIKINFSREIVKAIWDILGQII